MEWSGALALQSRSDRQSLVVPQRKLEPTGSEKVLSSQPGVMEKVFPDESDEAAVQSGIVVFFFQ